jgi:hypothetical protein
VLTMRTYLLLAMAATLLGATAPSAQTLDNFFLLHHSTGRNIINQGDVRDWLAAWDVEHGTDIRFWDHDYNYIGVANADGVLLGWDYGSAAGNTDPIGLHELWTTDNAARDSILNRHDVIAFKSCYPNSAIISDAMLQLFKDWYLEMRDVFDQHQDKVFVLMSTPPLHRLATNVEEADRARAFADWLSSPEYLEGHRNIVCFDLFDHLAHPDDGSDIRNMLRADYEVWAYGDDSHPNALANGIVGPAFAEFMVTASGLAGGAVDVPDVAPARLESVHPNPFNPSTAVTFSVDATTAVSLRVFDLRGRLVQTLAAGEQVAAGRHQRTWNGRDATGQAAPAGIYVCRLDAAGRTEALKMTLVE